MSDRDPPENEALDRLLDRIGAEERPRGLEETRLPELEGDVPLEGAGRPDRESELGREVLRNVRLRVRVELGRTRMPLGAALGLSSGSLVELDRTMQEPVDILVNDVPIARGQILVVDGRFCIRVTEVVSAAGSADGVGKVDLS